MTAQWTREALEALGPVTDVPTTASVLGIGEWTVYEAIRRGDWSTTRALKLGTKIKIPVADLIAAVYGSGVAPSVPSVVAPGVDVNAVRAATAMVRAGLDALDALLGNGAGSAAGPAAMAPKGIATDGNSLPAVRPLRSAP